jgi:hypothetical protein
VALARVHNAFQLQPAQRARLNEVLCSARKHASGGSSASCPARYDPASAQLSCKGTVLLMQATSTLWLLCHSQLWRQC